VFQLRAGNSRFDAMHAYLMTGLTERSTLFPADASHGRVEEYYSWVACDTRIVWTESREAARKLFGEFLGQPPEDYPPTESKIKRVVTAQFITELLTEAGPAPLHWAAIREQAIASLQSTPADDFEQGYWVDVGQAVPPEPLSASIDDLQREAPEDISAGLNWSEGKQFIYILSLFAPPAPPQELNELPSAEEKAAAAEFQEMITTYPEIADKEAAAIIKARNSVVAAWLWRRYAAARQLAELPIRIQAWCGVANLPPGSEP
jgi:hypothetical protein